MPDETLKRFGLAAESAERLAEQAAMAAAVLGVHGVSVTARDTAAPAGAAPRAEVERVFRVHDTQGYSEIEGGALSMARARWG